MNTYRGRVTRISHDIGVSVGPQPGGAEEYPDGGSSSILFSDQPANVPACAATEFREKDVELEQPFNGLGLNRVTWL